jgi:hypothetical protein
VVLAVAAITTSATAVPVPIPNASFEDAALADAAYTYGFNGAWNSEPGAGVWNPDDGIDPPDRYFDSLIMPDGVHVAFINYGSIWQTLTKTIDANVTYTLQVEVGWRNDQSRPLYDIILYAGDRSNGLASNSSTELIQGDWVTSTVTYTSYVSSAVPLGIWLVHKGGGQVDFDNVRLKNENHIPIPSTFLLFGTGLIGLIGVRRKFNG